MNKWILGAAAAVTVSWCGWLPFEAVDAGELYVVENLLVEADGRQVTLCAEDVSGSGKNLEEALTAMETNAPGRLFLRQTRRLIFCDGGEYYINMYDLPQELPVGMAVYRTERTAEELLEEKKLGEILEAREHREKEYPTLAKVKNALLLGKVPELEEI